MTDTKTPADRRELHFARIEDVMADVDALAAAEGQGKLRCVGNWTGGQILGHLAAWIGYGYDGAPFKTPFFVRWVMRPMKRRFLHKPMRAGMRIPRLPGGTAGIEPLSFQDGLGKCRAGFARLKMECPDKAHTLFGRLTHEEWIASHLRHAELHLSFLRAD